MRIDPKRPAVEYYRGNLQYWNLPRIAAYALEQGYDMTNPHSVSDFPKEKDAWREIDKLGLLLRINDGADDPRIRFNALAEHHFKSDFGDAAMRPKSATIIPIVEHYVRDYLIARWGNEIAKNIKPLDIQRWLKSLNTDSNLAWTTISKIKGICTECTKLASCMSA
jgi:hypothetical protein